MCRYPPTATYRLQFHRDFTFSRAAELVPYLSELGISHCYASPYLKARAGSPHGYDIVDHSSLNPEIGDRAEFDEFVRTLHAHDMGHILDLVPNHMGVGGDDNAWWLDVLENGPSAAAAVFFDIDWHPLKEQLRNKVLLPVLGDHYGRVLENGDIRLRFDGNNGEFSAHYYNHRFPIDPASYPRILLEGIDELAGRLGADDNDLLELQSLCTAFGHLPSRDERSPEKVEERRRDKEIHKKHLAELCKRSLPVANHIRRIIEVFNGNAADRRSYDRLHSLLESQPYRLAYWQVASDEINYRRFFDINDLAGLRMENPLVFAETHRLVLELFQSGALDGVRIDHPDGLHDPAGYFRKLNKEIRSVLPQAPLAPETDSESPTPPCYLVAEKILAVYEYLPGDWPIHGTTGYEFANLVNGLFVYPGSEHELTRLYARFTGITGAFDDILFERKELTVNVQLSSELTVLANMLDAIAQSDRRTRDYTLNGLRDALTMIVASFPVYRTYVTQDQVTEEDRRYVDWAVTQAKKHSPAADISIFDFVRDIVLLEHRQQRSEDERDRTIRFAMKFQQYTAPVMAKALEDTAFYIYNRLVSLNEVGGDPRRYGVSIAAFHHNNQERQQNWPAAMLTTSTHDTKRSEDVRSRINVLSEIPKEWQRQLARWSRLNKRKKMSVDGALAPSRNDEYLLYQTLLGTWPLTEPDADEAETYRKRIKAYMLKACKEAKVNTSWLNPNHAYEQAVEQFVDKLLDNPRQNRFLSDLIPFQQRIAHFGMLNSLSQLVLKLTTPGIPDIYQGNELWSFSLVDPDNRRPVDYDRRQALLREIKREIEAIGTLSAVQGMLQHLRDGRIKLFLTWTLLNFRRDHQALFMEGRYVPLPCLGEKNDHVCAFARHQAEQVAITIAPRWFARLGVADPASLVQGEGWQDAIIPLPRELSGGVYQNILTGRAFTVSEHLRLAEILNPVPWAVLFLQPPP